jgi:hypothetical protein
MSGARAPARGDGQVLERLVLLRGGLPPFSARMRQTSNPSVGLLMVESRTPRIHR